MAKNILLGALKQLKNAEGYAQHHPTIINSTNGDVIAYYYDYWVYSWGLLIFTMEAQANIANTYYGLRFMKYDSLSSLSLDNEIADKIDWSTVEGVETSEDDWNNLVKTVLESCKSGSNNGGLEYRDLQFDCGNWFDITHILDITGNIMQYKSNYIDVSGLGSTNRRMVTDISTIAQFSVPVKDYFRIGPVDNIVSEDKTILDGINKCMVYTKTPFYRTWVPPSSYGTTQSSYKYGDIVSRKNSETGETGYYISKIEANSTDPLLSSDSWIKLKNIFGGN